MGACQCIWPGRCLKMETFPESGKISETGSRKTASTAIQSRLRPASLQDLDNHTRIQLLTSNKGGYSALKVRYSKRNFSKIPICLKRRFAW